MSKLTLFFNNKAIDTFHLEQGESTVGREPSNTFIIDSLAIAPQHFKISRVTDDYFIESLSQQFPTMVNNKTITRQKISHGEKINIGKHHLYLTNTKSLDLNQGHPPAQQQPTADTSKTGHLQMTNGNEIGLVVALNKAVTELKLNDSTAAIIAKRQQGYFISRMADDVDIKIDRQAISAETKLTNNAKINIGTNKYIFFIE